MAKDDISRIKSITERMENPSTETEGEKNFKKKQLEDKRNPLTSLTYFTYLGEKTTGVKPIMLFVCDKVYKACSTKPYAYVCNGYLDVRKYVDSMDFIKISVSDNPQILSFQPPLKIFKKDILAAFDFIRKNKSLIIDLANGNIGTLGFMRSANKAVYGSLVHENKILSTDSGVMCDIWIDSSLSFENSKHNEPRIKFQPNQGVRETSEFATLILNGFVLDKKQEIKNEVNPKYFKEAKKFAVANKDNIIDLYNGKKTVEDFMEDLVTFDNGEPKPKKEWCLLDSEPSYGCRRILFADGTMNFINDNDEIVYPKNNFEDAEVFDKNNDGLIYSIVRYKNQKMILTQPDFKLSYMEIKPLEN